MNQRTKKYLLGGLLVILVSSAVSALVFAAGASPAPTAQQAATQPATAQPAVPKQAAAPGFDRAARFAQLTDKQKAELEEIQVQMMTLRQKMIGKYQEFGLIDADRANYMKDQIELQKKYAGTNAGMGFGGGMMGGGRRGMMRGPGHGPGMMSGYGYNQ